MDLIKSTKYYDILVSSDKKIAEIKWKKPILDMLIEEYKTVLSKAYSQLLDLKPEALLQNTQDAVYPITDELQEWLTENITKKIFEKIGLKKIAYLVPTDFLTKIGIEMLIQKANQKSTIARNFLDDYQKAIDWLRK